MAAAVAAATVVAAGVTLAVVVVRAGGIGIKAEIACQECIHRVIGITHNAAHHNNAGFCQCHPGAAANTAANQQIHFLLGKHGSQGAVAAAAGGYDLFINDLPCPDFIDLKSRGVAKVLENQFICVSYRNFRNDSSFLISSAGTQAPCRRRDLPKAAGP